MRRFAANIIVNAAKKRLRGGGGIDGVVHKADGPGLLVEVTNKFKSSVGRTGDAYVTGAHGLGGHVQQIVHAVRPDVSFGFGLGRGMFGGWYWRC